MINWGSLTFLIQVWLILVLTLLKKESLGLLRFWRLVSQHRTNYFLKQSKPSMMRVIPSHWRLLCQAKRGSANFVQCFNYQIWYPFDLNWWKVWMSQVELSQRVRHIKFLAEKVETYDEYQEANQAGFTYFQGYFFSKPEMIQTRALNPRVFWRLFSCWKRSLTTLSTLAAVERLITLDVTLSYVTCPGTLQVAQQQPFVHFAKRLSSLWAKLRKFVLICSRLHPRKKTSQIHSMV